MSTIAEHDPHPGAAVARLEPGSPVVEISLLGGFRLVVGGRDVTPHLRRRDARRLAEYLAMVPVNASTASDSSTRCGRTRRSTRCRTGCKAAHFLRRATRRDGMLVLSGDIVSLLPHARVETDVFVFRPLHEGLANRDRTAIDRAIALYGPTLVDHPYTEWVEYDRHRLRSRLRELLRISGGFDRLVAVDPTDEHAHVGLMRAMLHAGDPGSRAAPVRTAHEGARQGVGHRARQPGARTAGACPEPGDGLLGAGRPRSTVNAHPNLVHA